MTETIISLLVLNIPESLAILILSIVLLNKRIKVKTAIFMAAINGVCIFFLRKLPITFGFHTILFILLHCIELSYIYKVKFLKTVIPVFKTFIILTIYELTVVSLYSMTDSFKLEDATATPILRGMISLPQIVLLLTTALFINFLRKSKGKP